MRKHRLRLRWLIPFALAAIGMCVVAPSMAGASVNLKNSCKNTLTSGPNPGSGGQDDLVRPA